MPGTQRLDAQAAKWFNQYKRSLRLRPPRLPRGASRMRNGQRPAAYWRWRIGTRAYQELQRLGKLYAGAAVIRQREITPGFETGSFGGGAVAGSWARSARKAMRDGWSPGLPLSRWGPSKTP